jgi:hypothetical protein
MQAGQTEAEPQADPFDRIVTLTDDSPIPERGTRIIWMNPQIKQTASGRWPFPPAEWGGMSICWSLPPVDDTSPTWHPFDRDCHSGARS